MKRRNWLTTILALFCLPFLPKKVIAVEFQFVDCNGVPRDQIERIDNEHVYLDKLAEDFRKAPQFFANVREIYG